MKAKLPLIPTLFTIASLIVLLCLGTWQVQRLMWKTNIVAKISERVALPPINLPKGEIDLEALKYRKVIVTGQFLHDKEIHLFTGSRELRGDPGYNIFTPLEAKDGTVVLVDRGWVPTTKKDSATRPETLLKGKISVTGMLHEGEHKGTFTPDNDIARNLWFWIDIPAVAGFTGKALDNVYVRAIVEGEANDVLPIPGKVTIEVRNDHLQYAIIWYSFAIILVIIYTIYIKAPKLKNQVSGKKEEQPTTDSKKKAPKKTKRKANGKL